MIQLFIYFYSKLKLFILSDVKIPTNSGDGIQLTAGQSVMVIKTQKGTYLRLSDGEQTEH